MIVIPMAGLSQRFSDAGYSHPKYMLELKGRSVFAHAVASFERYFTTEPFLFITRDMHDTRAFIEAEVESLGLRDARTVVLPAATAGQADTVRLGLQGAFVEAADPLTIFNIDTFRPGFVYPEADWMHVADGYLEVMMNTDPSYSYALPSEAGDCRVSRTAEKEVISSLASTGLYWFRRAGDFLQAFSRARTHNNGEFYIAPMYNDLIKRALDIRYQIVSPEEVIFCGTPAQYEILAASDSHSRSAEAD